MLKRQAILFVDGYNMIGAWPHLASLMKQDELEKARDRLIFDLSQYKKMSDFAKVVVVFDAYQVPGVTKNFDQFDLTVVFTKEGETADAYIEREIAQYLSPVYRLIVATSDAAEQWLIVSLPKNCYWPYTTSNRRPTSKLKLTIIIRFAVGTHGQWRIS